MSDGLPEFEGLVMTRKGRRLDMTLNRPELLNAFDEVLHRDLPSAIAFAATDPGSDLIVLTGAGRAFSAGGDVAFMEHQATHPDVFDEGVAAAKAIVFGLLDLEKPIICRMNGHAVGLGATVALLCDIVIASESAKIGDPHVNIGLVAGDGGAIVWAARIGAARAKEYLLTGDLITASKAAEIGLINRAVPPDALDAEVDAMADKLLGTAQAALRWTKRLTNMELRRMAEPIMEAGIAWESESVRTADHREAIAAFRDKRPPRFGQG